MSAPPRRSPSQQRLAQEQEALRATIALPQQVAELTTAVNRLAHILCLAAGIDPDVVADPWVGAGEKTSPSVTQQPA